MALDQKRRKALEHKAVEELKTFLIVFLYLLLFLGAFQVYRALILAEFHLHPVSASYAVVEAAVLAKVILLGAMMKVGSAFDEKPLFIPTLYKIFSFALLVLAFSLGEHFLVGLLRGHSLRVSLQALLAEGWPELAARVVIMVVAFVPFFILWELARVQGADWLVGLFFRPRPEKALPPSEGPRA